MLARTIRRWFPPEKRKFLIVSTGMILLNALVLMGLVKLLGNHPLAANIIRQVITTPIHFVAHRKFTWGSHVHDGLWRQFGRYLSLKAGSMLSKQLCYWILVSWLKTPYMLAYVLCVCVFGMSKFSLTKRFVFKNKSAHKPQPHNHVSTQ